MSETSDTKECNCDQCLTSRLRSGHYPAPCGTGLTSEEVQAIRESMICCRMMKASKLAERLKNLLDRDADANQPAPCGTGLTSEEREEIDAAIKVITDEMNEAAHDGFNQFAHEMQRCQMTLTTLLARDAKADTVTDDELREARDIGWEAAVEELQRRGWKAPKH